MAPLLIYVWWKTWQGSERKLYVAAGYAALMAGVVLVVQAPWLAWNWHTFGTLMQSSGASFSFVNHQLLYNVHANDLVTNIKGALLGLMNAGKILLYAFAAPLVYAIVLGAAILLRRRAGLSFRSQTWGFLVAAVGGILAVFLTHGAIRWAYRTWYAAPLVLVVVLAIAYCSRELRQLTLPRYLVAGLAVLSLASFALAAPRLLSEYSSQSRSYEVAQWINQNVALEQKVGAFNSGIYAYFSGRTVVDLDGLVNNSAATALRDRDLRDYATIEEISYLVDYDISVNYRYAWAWDNGKSKIEDNPVVHVFEDGSRNGAIRVYKLQ